MPAIPLLTHHLHHSIILIMSHQWRQCPTAILPVAEPITNWKPCPNGPNCPSAFNLGTKKWVESCKVPARLRPVRLMSSYLYQSPRPLPSVSRNNMLPTQCRYTCYTCYTSPAPVNSQGLSHLWQRQGTVFPSSSRRGGGLYGRPRQLHSAGPV